MRSSAIDKQLIAGNIYPRWRKMIRSAKFSIAVFTPYLDSTLVRLLQNKPDSVNYLNVTVVTDFEAESFVTGRSRMFTMKQLIESGVQVRHLASLHAKVLLIDDAYVAIGSQNFTKKGQKNKEASIRFSESIASTEFLSRLREWLRAAEDVDSEFVEKLLNEIAPLSRKYRTLLNQADDTFLNKKETLRLKRLERRWRNILRAEEIFRPRLAHGEIFASLKRIESLNTHYYSLVPDGNYDLTKWIIMDEKESNQQETLRRLSFYPVWMLDTLRMGFARVGKQRITYVHSNVDWTGHRIISINDSIYLSGKAEFPSENTNTKNIQINLTDRYDRRNCVEVDILCEGSDFTIVGRRYTPLTSKDFIAIVESNLFKKKQESIPFLVDIDQQSPMLHPCI